MSNDICYIDHQPIEGPVKHLGHRVYCERHFNNITKPHRGAWISKAALIVGLLIFTLAVSGLSPLIGTLPRGLTLIVVGVIVSLVPSVLWLAFFIAQDYLEPEPKGYVLGVFLMGALLAKAVGQPLIEDFFQVAAWADSLVLHLAAGVLIVGVIQTFLIYAAVRYTVYKSGEFDERIDGIVYCAAAGLGYATVLNINYVMDNGGVNLGIGVYRIVVTALAQASFAGLVGYFLGRARFEHMGALWMPLGLALAAVLNGVVTVSVGAISRGSLQATPLNGLVLAALSAAIVFGLLLIIMHRDDEAVLKAAT
jgi:RsiW-degrading membrane proteinase PrsW (M82 family)